MIPYIYRYVPYVPYTYHKSNTYMNNMYHKATNQDARLKQNKERQFKEPSLTSGRDKHLLDQKKLYGQMRRQPTNQTEHT